MQLRRYNSDRLVVQYWAVASTASELLLAFRTNAVFVLQDTTFVAAEPFAIFPRFGSETV